ncbi:MAG: LuxR C-terminal-related transcriptional regulator [Clostridiales bacterium]|jgi:DNA-binding CsgD family transcriptional regulator|nr:LuxR C-terminal-related transcriptional regulator [Clostridiales bacterium]
MTNAILRENEGRRLELRLPMLICFAMFTAWQIGAFSYSGAALAVEGRLPFGVDAGNFTPLIAAGYLVSIAVMAAFPKRIVWVERAMAAAALTSALALYLPLAREARTLAYLAQLFCCCVMIGFETAIIVGLFSELTAIRHLLVAYGIIFAVAGFMQNQFPVFAIPYSVFQHFNVAAIALQMVFYCRLPSGAGAWPRYVEKWDAAACPKKLFGGLLGLCFLGNILISFGLSVAEGVTHGVFVFDCSFAVFAIAGYVLLRRFGASPLRVATISVIVSVVGFVVAMLALYLPALALPACALLGPGTAANILIPYYGVVMTKRYPSRYVAPAVIGISFVSSVLLLAWLIELFRDDTALLFTMYIAIALVMAILYLALEPYLLYSFHGRRLISDERAVELNEAARAAGGEGAGAAGGSGEQEARGAGGGGTGGARGGRTGGASGGSGAVGSSAGGANGGGASRREARGRSAGADGARGGAGGANSGGGWDSDAGASRREARGGADGEWRGEVAGGRSPGNGMRSDGHAGYEAQGETWRRDSRIGGRWASRGQAGDGAPGDQAVPGDQADDVAHGGAPSGDVASGGAPSGNGYAGNVASSGWANRGQAGNSASGGTASDNGSLGGAPAGNGSLDGDWPGDEYAGYDAFGGAPFGNNASSSSSSYELADSEASDGWAHREDESSQPDELGDSRSEVKKGAGPELTDRERQVAQELMYGYDAKQIAKRLYISPSTVATHRKNIYSKLEVHNVPELIAKLSPQSAHGAEGSEAS